MDFHETVLAMTSWSGSFGCGSGIGRSPPPMRPVGLGSVLTSVQLAGIIAAIDAAGAAGLIQETGLSVPATAA